MRIIHGALAFTFGRRQLTEGEPEFAAPFRKEGVAAKPNIILYRSGIVGYFILSLACNPQGGGQRNEMERKLEVLLGQFSTR